MTVTPEDLVEAWHLFTANGDEPFEWILDDNLWSSVERCIAAGDCIDAGDPLRSEGARTLLGTPVAIEHGAAAKLRFRRDGEMHETVIQKSVVAGER
jgi:hypothetical protein